jgi:hypothetical protein
MFGFCVQDDMYDKFQEHLDPKQMVLEYTNS